MKPIQTILHPTDFSESASHAFRLACSLARDHQARLVVLHVVPPPYPIIGEIMPPQSAGMVGEPAEWESLRQKLRAMKPASGDFPIQQRLEVGEPVEAILAVAKEIEAGLIVLGTHGRTGLPRLLMGSVAEQIVRKASCSVLTVKTPVAHSESVPSSQTPDVERLAYT